MYAAYNCTLHSTRIYACQPAEGFGLKIKKVAGYCTCFYAAVKVIHMRSAARRTLDRRTDTNKSCRVNLGVFFYRLLTLHTFAS